MSDKLTAAEAVEEIGKRLARHDERGDYTKADFVNSVRVILSRVSPQAEPTPIMDERIQDDFIRLERLIKQGTRNPQDHQWWVDCKESLEHIHSKFIAAESHEERALQLVNQQAEMVLLSSDEGLWFMAQTAPEAYLQQELRKLHTAVEANAAQPKSLDADSIRRARDREWCNRLEIQETLRPNDRELDVHLAFMCRKADAGVDAEKVRGALKFIYEYQFVEDGKLVELADSLHPVVALLEDALGDKR